MFHILYTSDVKGEIYVIFSVYRSGLFKFLKPSNTYFCFKFYFLSILLYLTFNKYNIFNCIYYYFDPFAYKK